MKCAKEVVKQWEVSTEGRYKNDLTNIVERVTEKLFALASKGVDEIPCVEVWTSNITNGRPGAVKIRLRGDKEYSHVVIWEDFLTIMVMLCYHVAKDPYCSSIYTITPNPSC